MSGARPRRSRRKANVGARFSIFPTWSTRTSPFAPHTNRLCGWNTGSRRRMSRASLHERREVFECRALILPGIADAPRVRTAFADAARDESVGRDEPGPGVPGDGERRQRVQLRGTPSREVRRVDMADEAPVKRLVDAGPRDPWNVDEHHARLQPKRRAPPDQHRAPPGFRKAVVDVAEGIGQHEKIFRPVMSPASCRNECLELEPVIKSRMSSEDRQGCQ